VKRSLALLLLIGLICMPAVYAQDGRAPHPSGVPAAAEPPFGGMDHPKIKSGENFVALNFTNVDISALVKVMSELTRRNFILDERVTGKVTIMTPTKISPDEAYQVFLSALEIKGFTAVEDGQVTRIIPAASARQSGLKVLQDGSTAGEGFVTKLIRMNFVNPQEIVRTIIPLVTKDGSLIPYPPTNSVIITDSVSNIRKIESLIRALDVAAPEGQGKINVYYLKNANAEEIAKLMQALVSRLPVPPPAGSPQAVHSPATILEGTVTITADKATNSLIIVGTPADFETMKDVIQKLDIRRRQVYVEVAIIEMSLTKMRDLGFELQAPIKSSSLTDNATSVSTVGGTNFGNIGNVIAGGPAAFAQMSGLAVGVVKGTFTFGGKQFLSVGALLHALQTDGNVNVLSTPNLLTMDNQKAEIMVGQNVPFITGQTQNAVTGSQTLFNTVNRQDVGIKLSLTPQIASDDNVRLEVNQEISDVIASTLTNQAGPTTSKRSASTTVVVKDRQTMVIGGLIRDNVTSSESKVPFLGDIPILGWLFKSKTTSIDKTNLMIFITPYIIKNEGEAGDLTRQKNEDLEKFREEYRIEKKGTEPVILMPKKDEAAEQPAQGMKSGITPTTPPAIEELIAPLQSGATATTPAGAAPVPAAEQPAPAQDMDSSSTTTQQPAAPVAPQEGVR
jgi:general secretion pathway protein D